MTSCGPPKTLDVVEIRCPAKVNLVLKVQRAKPNTPLHNIASWMIPIGLYDHLTVRRLPNDTASTADIHFNHDSPRQETVDWPLDRDLAVRAHRACEKHLGRSLPVAITLSKRIPTGGGLGGGSSDAAGMLVALNQLFDTPITPDALHDIACTLGGDVPFALAALTRCASAIVTGSGNIVTPVSAPRCGHLVLLIPPFGCPTASVFAALDAAQGGCDTLNTKAIRALTQIAAAPTPNPNLWTNDLTDAACTLEPRLNAMRSAAALLHHPNLFMTGSGSVCFVPCTDHPHALQTVRTVRSSSSPAFKNVAAIAVRYGGLIA